MSTAAIIALKQEQQLQAAKLADLVDEHKETIQRGDRAKRAVQEQERHVAELVEAIATLESEFEKRTVVVV